MRIVFVGAGETVVNAACGLREEGHEVVIIEKERSRIDELSEVLDCSFLHADGGTPAALQEVNPKQTDFLFCLSDDDRANIIASLVGRSLGFTRVVTSIEDPDLEDICRELGLKDVIIPVRSISPRLCDMVRGLDDVELSTVLKAEVRLFSFKASKEDAAAIGELDLPEEARVIYFYRGEKFCLPQADTQLKAGDEVVIVTHARHLPDLKERWEPKRAGAESG